MKLKVKDGENVFKDGRHYLGAAVWQLSDEQGTRLSVGSKQPAPDGGGGKAQWVGAADDDGTYRTKGDELDWPDDQPVPAWAEKVALPAPPGRFAKTG